MIPRPRNAKGWIIPREGSASRALYECMMSNIPRDEVWELLQRQWGLGSIITFRTMVHNIRYPDNYNLRQQTQYHRTRRQLRFKFTFPESRDA